MRKRVKLDDSKYFWSLYELLRFNVVCKEEKTSMHRSFEVLKYEGFEFYTVFDADNLDEVLLFVYEVDRDELIRNKKIQEIKMNMLQYFDEIFSFERKEEERRKRNG